MFFNIHQDVFAPRKVEWLKETTLGGNKDLNTSSRLTWNVRGQASTQSSELRMLVCSCASLDALKMKLFSKFNLTDFSSLACIWVDAYSVVLCRSVLTNYFSCCRISCLVFFFFSLFSKFIFTVKTKLFFNRDEFFRDCGGR